MYFKLLAILFLNIIQRKNLMKNLLLVLFSLFAFSSAKADIIDQKFNFTSFKIKSDFYGILDTKKNILIYGSNGLYYLSEDRANTWYQKRIDSKSSINKLFYDSTSNKIIGFTNDGTLLLSNDQGNTWNLKKLNFIDKFVNCEVDKDYYYIRTDGGLVVMDKSYNLVSKVSSVLFKHNINFSDIEKHAFLEVDNDKILFNSYLIAENNNDNKLIFYIKKENLFKNKLKIDTLFNYCDTCKDINVQKFFKYKNQLYIWFSSSKNIVLDSNYNFLKEIKLPFINSNLFIQNNEIYIFQLQSPSYLNLFKYDMQTEKVDTISKIDLNLNNSFLYYFSDFKIINDSCYIFCTSENNIFITLDKGKTWENKFRFRENIKKISYLNDSNISSIYEPYIVSFSHRNNVLQEKWYNHSNLKAPFSFEEYYKSSYIDSTGKLIIIRSNQSNNPSYAQNVLISNDFGKTFSPKSMPSIDYSWGTHVYFDKYNDKFYNVQNVKIFNKNHFFIFEFDSNMNLQKTYHDSIYKIQHFLVNSNDNFVCLAKSNSNPNKSLSIIQSKDFFKSKVELNTIDVKYDYIRTYNLGKNKDSILIITYLGMDKTDSSNVESNIFLYVLSENKFTKLYSSNSISRPKILLDFEEHLYIVGKNCLLENTNRSDLSAWKKYDIIDNSNWDYCESYNAKSQKVQVAYFSNANYPYTLYEISEDFVNEIKNESQTENNNAIYTTAPYPIPAKDHIKILVYWDNTVNFEKFEFNVYDIKGNLMKLNEKASIKQINSYSGYLEVDCSALPNGIYIVNIKNDGINKSISVVIEK